MNETNTDKNQVPRISKLAKVSLICVIISICLSILVVSLHLLILKGRVVKNFDIPMVKAIGVTSFTGLVLGIAALIQIWKSNVPLSGSGRAVIAIILSIIIALFITPIFTPYRLPSRLICATQVKGLGTSIMVYAHYYDDRLPTLENWCDLLIVYADVDPRAFVCPESDAKVGESSYALNENVAGMKLSEIPGDVVLMFETSFGRTKQARTGRVKSRQYFQYFAERQQSEERRQSEIRKGDDKVYILRWNQVGGPEDLTTEYHKGIGCNFLFADCSAWFIKKEELDTLRWEP